MIMDQGPGQSDVDAGEAIKGLASVPFNPVTLARNVKTSLTSFLFIPEHHELDSVIILMSMIPQCSVFPEV